MTKLFQWDAKVTPGNVVSWLLTAIGVVVMVVWLQADIKALNSSQDRMDKRVSKVEDRADRLNESIGEMKGDIKVIRQMLEGQKARP